jgi:Arc/MetJ-type ribon-helix-helix transcriptional regulator
MKRKPQAYVAALPLSQLPDLQDLLAPFFAAKGQPRDHVVMVRLGNEALERLDELVEAGFSSRSEAAAFLVGAGIRSQGEFFARITQQAAEIKRLRDELLQTAREALSATAPPPAQPKRPRGRRAADSER